MVTLDSLASYPPPPPPPPPPTPSVRVSTDSLDTPNIPGSSMDDWLPTFPVRVYANSLDTPLDQPCFLPPPHVRVSMDSLDHPNIPGCLASYTVGVSADSLDTPDIPVSSISYPHPRQRIRGFPGYSDITGSSMDAWVPIPLCQVSADSLVTPDIHGCLAKFHLFIPHFVVIKIVQYCNR